jgi:organic radical activating enzyme
MEDINPHAMSDRKRFTNEPWALERREQILNSSYDTHINPAYLEISFANTCNFACSYCSPGQSSRWEQEIRRLGSYPVDDFTVHQDKMHDMIPEDNNVYIDAFWEWLPKIYKDLRVLRITGGEPLATKNFMKLLDYVANNDNPELVLAINTNLCVPKMNLDLFFEKATALREAKTIKELQVFTSIDTWGPQAEYIRDGLDVETWENTVRKIANEFNIPIRIMVTFGLMSVFNFKHFVNKVLEMRSQGINIIFNVARLTDPKHFDLRILPDHCDKYFEDVNDFIKRHDNSVINIEKETWQMAYNYWKSRKETMTEEDREYRTDQFSKFANEYDKRREKNFHETFPELQGWI